MPKIRPQVLSIAGFDPSGGAGILADIKTFEQHKVMGMGAITGLTFQNDTEFTGVTWIENEEIKRQIDILFKKFKLEIVKIGMVKNLETIHTVITHLASANPAIKIIWDPILKASAGFQIHSEVDTVLLQSILKKIYLLTPNIEEIKILSASDDAKKGAKDIAAYCNVFLKGGHADKNIGKDFLFTAEGKEFSFNPKKISSTGKHGSGCVLSSAIAANLAGGYNLHHSCLKAKDYTTKFLHSNKTLLGYHKS